MSIRLLSSLLLCCLLLVGCCPPEQPIVQPPEQPAVRPPEQRFSVPTPWEPTGRTPWQLTDSEKEKVVEIALNTPEVSEWLESQQQFWISKISWYALWDGGMANVPEEEIGNSK